MYVRSRHQFHIVRELAVFRTLVGFFLKLVHSN